jgi:arsenite-transporting ATPase
MPGAALIRAAARCIALKPFNLVGLDALRQLLGPHREARRAPDAIELPARAAPSLAALVEDIAATATAWSC